MRHNLVSGWKHTDEARLKIAESRRGPLNCNFGKVSPRRKVFATKEDLQEFINAGMTVREIATKLAVDRATIQKWTKRFGIRITKEQWSERLVRGDRHHKFIGAKRLKRGYVFLRRPKHPAADQTGYVAEHRLVVEEFLGRFLTGMERVHHINFAKQDNRIENFILFHSNSEHALFHKWMEVHGAFAIGAIAQRPANLVYETPVLVAGRWCSEIGVDTLGLAVAA